MCLDWILEFRCERNMYEYWKQGQLCGRTTEMLFDIVGRKSTQPKLMLCLQVHNTWVNNWLCSKDYSKWC